MAELKKRIRKEVQLIIVQTTLGTAVSITKKEAYRFLDMLASRNVEPTVNFTEIGNGKMLMVIE